jgi:hypothetical protein
MVVAVLRAEENRCGPASRTNGNHQEAGWTAAAAALQAEEEEPETSVEAIPV